MKKKNNVLSWIGTGIFTVLGIIYIMPILIVLMNSFKKKVYINKMPFQLPTEKTMAGIENYITAIDKYELLDAVGWTVFITVGSVFVILICTSMCAWYITRINTKFTKTLYLLCVFSMVVPFQMVMFTLALVADRTGLRTPWGIIIIYLGFGAGLAVFMFCGFVKSIPLEIEEAAMIDGAGRWKRMWYITLPGIKGTAVTLLIMNLGKVMNSNLERLQAFANSQVRDFEYQLAVYIYEKGLNSGHFSEATAVGLFQSLVGLFLVLASDKVAKGLGEDGLL